LFLNDIHYLLHSGFKLTLLGFFSVGRGEVRLSDVTSVHLGPLARMFHELLSRDHEDGRATWQPQGVGSEAYLNGTSQEPAPEDARKDDHIRGRSR
jgi:hypothetical protein